MTLKLKTLTADNFKNFDRISVSFNDDITFLTGPNGANKSSLGVDILWTVLQGIGTRSTSKDNTPIIGERYMVIGSKSPSAKLSVTLHDTKTKQDIVVRRKVKEDGTELSFEGPDGMVMDQRWLNEIFNLFLISPKKFLQLSPRDQAISLGIDLSEYDKKLKVLKESFTQIGRDVKAIGELVPVPPTEAVDVSALVKEKDERVKFNNVQIELEGTWKKVNESLLKLTNEKTTAEKSIIELNNLHAAYEALKYTTEDSQSVVKAVHSIVSGKVNDLMEIVFVREKSINKGIEYSSTLSEPKPLQGITSLDAQIADASSINVKASQYAQYLEKRDKKAKLEADKEKNQEDQAEVNRQRTEKIQSLELPFADLTCSEEGELLLQNRYIKEEYFSSSELIITTIMIIISSMKRKGEIKFPFCFLQEFSLLDEDNQQKIIDFCMKEGIQLVCEVVSTHPIGKVNEIFLKDGVIHQE